MTRCPGTSLRKTWDILMSFQSTSKLRSTKASSTEPSWRLSRNSLSSRRIRERAVFTSGLMRDTQNTWLNFFKTWSQDNIIKVRTFMTSLMKSLRSPLSNMVQSCVDISLTKSIRWSFISLQEQWLEASIVFSSKSQVSSIDAKLRSRPMLLRRSPWWSLNKISQTFTYWWREGSLLSTWMTLGNHWCSKKKQIWLLSRIGLIFLRSFNCYQK